MPCIFSLVFIVLNVRDEIESKYPLFEIIIMTNTNSSRSINSTRLLFRWFA